MDPDGGSLPGQASFRVQAPGPETDGPAGGHVMEWFAAWRVALWFVLLAPHLRGVLLDGAPLSTAHVAPLASSAKTFTWPAQYRSLSAAAA